MSETKYTFDNDVEPGSDVLIVTQESDAPVGRIYGFDHFPCFDPDEKSPAEAHAETVALADRFVSCVNNLAGLNPEGVRDLIAACEAIMRSSFSGDEARDLFSAIAAVAGSDIGPDIHERCGRLDAALNDLAAALAKVKGQSE